MDDNGAHTATDSRRQDHEAWLLARWPAMAERLGERRVAFLDAAWRQAAKRGLTDSAAAMRYLNLCFAFGPAFEERPENEWALALLADQRLAPSARLHQLVLRARQTLRRRGGNDEPALARADAALLDALDVERRADDGDAPPLARVACDIEAIDLRVLDNDWRCEYRKLEGAWQRLPGPAAAPAVRIDAAHPAPPVICVLTHAEGAGPAARLQLRQILHGGCAGERHPAVRWIDSQGLNAWQGHAARAVSWPVRAQRTSVAAGGLGLALIEETSADIGLLDVPSCGLRDEGLPLGPQRTQVWAYPAHQWLYAVQREAGGALSWPATGAAQAPPPATRCRIERDGAALDARAWVQGFDTELPRALSQGFGRLFEVWKGTAQNPVLRLNPGLLTGRQALTWGWREGAGGLVGAPVMRVLGDFDIACSLDLTLEGEIESGGARTALQLHAAGNARLTHTVQRDNAAVPLLASLGAAVLRLRFPFVVLADPYANDNGTLCGEIGPCSGALVGEAGLRPRLSGGSGWQWYLRLSLEAVQASMTLQDPVLGSTRSTLSLLPAMQLVDWSLG